MSESVLPSALEGALDALTERLDILKPGVDYGAGGAEFIEQATALSVVRRLDSVLTLLREGVGGVVTGATARGLLDNALLALWREGGPGREASGLVTLSNERARLVAAAEKHELSVPSMDRWLHPVALPSLLVMPRGDGLPDPARIVRHHPAVAEAILGMPACVADLLAMCAHANYAGAWCTVDDPPHAMGIEATAPYAAIFAQCAGRSAATVVAGSAFDGVIDEVSALTTGASDIHGLPVCHGSPPAPDVPGRVAVPLSRDIDVYVPTNLHDELLEDVLVAGARLADLIEDAPSPFMAPTRIVHLRAALPYVSALTTLETCIRAATGRLHHEIAAIAARLLLEEGTRMRWVGLAPTEAALNERYVAVADDETARRGRLRRQLVDAGVGPDAIAALFESIPPERVRALDRLRTPPHEKAPRLAPPSQYTADAGLGFAEPGWLALAYSLLSQVAHATPLGVLHTVARFEDDYPVLSHEMTALAVDAASVGAALLLPTLTKILELGGRVPPVDNWIHEVGRRAATVHRRAQRLHFLD